MYLYPSFYLISKNLNSAQFLLLCPVREFHPLYFFFVRLTIVKPDRHFKIKQNKHLDYRYTWRIDTSVPTYMFSTNPENYTETPFLGYSFSLYF